MAILQKAPSASTPFLKHFFDQTGKLRNSELSGEWLRWFLRLGRDIEAALKFTKSQVFTASGTWVKPANVEFVQVLLIGGGAGAGGGGGTNTTASFIAGGGGGAQSGQIVWGYTTVSGDVTVTIGAGGVGGLGQLAAGGQTGTDGTATTFGSELKAKGGLAGVGGATNGGSGLGGAGGSADALEDNSLWGTKGANGRGWWG